MMLEPERAARLVAERLGRPQMAAAPADSGSSAGADGHLKLAATEPGPGRHSRDWLVRRTLEELGIHCESEADLQDLKGFMIASPRGAEIVVSERLGPDDRLEVYAHLLAHALLEQGVGDEEEMQGSFFSRLEYVEGREPADRSSAERRAEMVADAIAKAILRGRLDGAPRYTFRQKREATASSGIRPRLGRFFLELCHRTSLALFWRSPKYQKLRGRPEMSALVRRVEGLVRTAYAC